MYRYLNSIPRYARDYATDRLGRVANMAVCLGTMLPVLAHAQALPNPGSPLPGVQRPNEPAVSLPRPAASQAEPAPVNPSVTVPIDDVSVQDATAYSQASLAAMTAGLTGAAVSAARIEAARVAILNRYRRDGFVYTAVDARIRGRQLRFVITEAHIAQIKLEGHIGPAATQVLRFLNHLTDIQPIDTKSLERWLLLAGDVPGVSVTAVLNPSVENPGALTLVAKLTRRAVTGTLSADNRGFRQTGPEELLATADFNSFTSFGERTELSIYHTFNNTETFGQASEEFFIGGSGLKAKFYGGDGETIPSGSLRAIGYDGVTRVFGAELSYPYIRTRQQTLNLTLNFDGIESRVQTDTGTGRFLNRTTFDSLRVLSAGADYSLLDLLAGSTRPANDLASLHVSQGLPTFGASPNGDASASILGERVDFTKVSGEVDRTQALFTPFAGGNLAVRLGATGQYSGDTLPASEKFYLGGPHFGRGFYYGQVTGDSALEATVEPLLDTALPSPSFIKLKLAAQFYAFYDWGETWEQSRLEQDHTLRSIGGGVRLYGGERFEIDVEGDSRLTRTPNGSPPAVSRLKSSAVYWQAVAHF